MDTSKIKSLSKFLSYLLRHHPESIGLSLDKNGWAKVSELIEKAGRENKSLDRKTIEAIIKHGQKQRFILSDDEEYIRAGYGHSIDVDLQMKSKSPPNELYHGTAQQNVQSILREGIKAENRNFVHLSTTKKEAKSVGSRHGVPVILIVNAIAMSQKGYRFYQSRSEVSIWLTKKIPAKYVLTQD